MKIINNEAINQFCENKGADFLHRAHRDDILALVNEPAVFETPIGAVFIDPSTGAVIELNPDSKKIIHLSGGWHFFVDAIFHLPVEVNGLFDEIGTDGRCFFYVSKDVLHEYEIDPKRVRVQYQSARRIGTTYRPDSRKD